VNRPTDRYLRFPRVGLRRISGNGLSGCGHAIPPTGGRKLTASEYQSQMVPFAMELANRISLRLEHHISLTSFEMEDIEQELLTYLLERASQFDPTKGTVEAFVTRMMRTAAARLIRGSNRRRSNPPPGYVVDSLWKMVEGPDRKSEELNCGLTSTDGTRRLQTEPRDPFHDVELADAVEHQINTLPCRYRRIARLLRTHNQNEIANKLGLSKQKISRVLTGIREHFACVDWSESGFFWDVVSANCIASTGEDIVFQTTQESDMEKST
jgi:RNA polymerase sigma factor (sigma-70 family)